MCHRRCTCTSAHTHTHRDSIPCLQQPTCLAYCCSQDEIGVAVLSAGVSPYFPLFFMTDEPSFRPYFSFEQAPARDRARWIECFELMLRKLTLRAGGERMRLLLKSPAHTARVSLLLQLFPDAQFVYIHRRTRHARTLQPRVLLPMLTRRGRCAQRAWQIRRTCTSPLATWRTRRIRSCTSRDRRMR